MGIEFSLILGTIIFVFLIHIVISILSHHWYQKWISLGFYFIAIAPNLNNIFSELFTLDRLIMAFFDSLYIYILFSFYLVAVIILRIVKSKWVMQFIKGKFERKLPSKRRESKKDSTMNPLKNVMQTIKRDLKMFDK